MHSDTNKPVFLNKRQGQSCLRSTLPWHQVSPTPALQLPVCEDDFVHQAEVPEEMRKKRRKPLKAAL